MVENYEPTEQQLTDLRNKEIDLYKVFSDVCNQLKLPFFVVQGTLLGAVRHHGFIPWDDDIDVGMLRKDYDVFIAEAPRLLPDHVFLQNHDTDPEYMHCFAKLRDSRTTFIEKTAVHQNINHGVYIDIFPFDYYPKGVIRHFLYDCKKLMVRYRVRDVYFIPSDNLRTPQNAVRSILKKISRHYYPTMDDAMRDQDATFRKTKPSRRIINNGSPWGKRECFPACWVQSTAFLPFEGQKVPAPKKFKKYLRHVYGEYWILPPREQRKTHHYLYYLDLNRPFTEFSEGKTGKQ